MKNSEPAFIGETANVRMGDALEKINADPIPAKNRIFVDDPVSRMEGGPETEIRENESIRFEIADDKFLVSIKNGKLYIYKSTDGIDGYIHVTPRSSNVIEVY